MKHRGFTLLEAMVTLALVLLLLGVLGALIGTYARVVRRSSTKDMGAFSAQVALNAVRSEVNQAIAIELPEDGEEGPDLHLLRIDPFGTARFVGRPYPSSWVPHRVDEVVEIEFFLEPGSSANALKKLYRYSDGFEYVEVICEGLEGMNFAYEDRELRISASVQDDQGQVNSFEALVVPHLPPNGLVQ